MDAANQMKQVQKYRLLTYMKSIRDFNLTPTGKKLNVWHRKKPNKQAEKKTNQSVVVIGIFIW